MKRPAPLWYYDPILLTNFWFFIGWDSAACEKFCRRHFNFDDIGFENRSGRCIEFDNFKGKHAIAIWTREKPAKHAQFMGTLVHEVVHAVNMACSSRKIKLDMENDEFQAYLTAHLVRVALGMKVQPGGGFA